MISSGSGSVKTNGSVVRPNLAEPPSSAELPNQNRTFGRSLFRIYKFCELGEVRFGKLKLGELSELSFGIYMLGALGEVSFGKLKLGELGEVSFRLYKFFVLGEVSFEMLKLGELGEVSFRIYKLCELVR